MLYRLWLGRNGEPRRVQLLAPRGIREDIVKMSHGGMYGGHMGIAKTCDQVQRRVFCFLAWLEEGHSYVLSSLVPVL